jgi:hypothetical protein
MKYRKVYPGIWNDRKFRALSDNAKLVFFFLLTHPHLTSLGAMRGNLPGLAYELGWSLERFSEAFQEVLTKGMVRYDKCACFIWLPNYLKYNKPESPNVVKSWVAAADDLPECDLKDQLFHYLDVYQKDLTEGFQKAYQKAFRKPSKRLGLSKTKAKTKTNNNISSEVCDTSEPPVLSIPIIKQSKNDPDEFPIYQADIDEWQDTFPAIDVLQTLKRIRQWNVDNPKRRKTKQGIRRHITSWLAREQDKGRVILQPPAAGTGPESAGNRTGAS